MGFIKEVADKLSVSLGESVYGYQMSVFNGAGIAVEGHRGIMFYSDTAIKIRLKKGYLEIGGKDLTISEINEEDVFITGNIIRTERVEDAAEGKN